MKEIFKDIPGWEGRYQASNLGQIKSLGNDKARKEKILKTRKWKNYEKVVLCKEGKRHFFQVHVLVWSAFNGPIPDGLEIDHIDGNPTNNTLNNLRAVSHLTNLMNPVTVKRREEWNKKRHNSLTPEEADKRRKAYNKKQLERYHRRKEREFANMLESHGLTEEEYLKNKEEERKTRLRAYSREYYKKNKEKMCMATKKWKSAHSQEVKEYHRAYWEENKHKYRANIAI